jgi:Phosphoserine phosphatase
LSFLGWDTGFSGVMFWLWLPCAAPETSVHNVDFQTRKLCRRFGVADRIELSYLTSETELIGCFAAVRDCARYVCVCGRARFASAGFAHRNCAVGCECVVVPDEGPVVATRESHARVEVEVALIDIALRAAWRRAQIEVARAVGDGSNDVPMLGEADVGIAFLAKNGVAEAARKRGGVIYEVKHSGLDALPYLFLSRVGS